MDRAQPTRTNDSKFCSLLKLKSLAAHGVDEFARRAEFFAEISNLDVNGPVRYGVVLSLDCRDDLSPRAQFAYIWLAKNFKARNSVLLSEIGVPSTNTCNVSGLNDNPRFGRGGSLWFTTDHQRIKSIFISAGSI